MLLRIEIKATERNDNDFWIAQDTVIVTRVKNYLKLGDDLEEWYLADLPDFIEDTVGAKEVILSKKGNVFVLVCMALQNYEDEGCSTEFKIHKVSVVTDFPIP